MSSSKDRIARRELREVGQDKHQLAKAREDAARRKSRLKYIAVAAVIVLVFVFIFTYNSALPSRTLTGVTIGDETYTVAQLNYYYSNAYQNFYSTYNSYIQYGMFFNTNESLGDQQYSEDMTWREYFIDSAVTNMKQVQALYNAGVEAGFALTDEQTAEYDELCAGIETNWAAYGYSSLEQYVNMVYGKGVDIDLVKQELYRNYYASTYAQSIYDGYEYSGEELDGYYAEHKDELDFLSYAYYYVSADSVPEGSTAEAITQTVCDAVNGSDGDAFTAYVSDNYDGASVTSTKAQGGNLSDLYSAWLLDGARTAGEATAIEADTGWYVVMYLGRDDNNYPTRSFRHILINAVDADGDSAFSEEEVQTAVDAAQALYDEWLAGDATEDSFAELANANSDDSGSNTTGGLYEGTVEGQMVPPVNDWVFGDVKPGDSTVVVYNEGGSYTGAHVLYYVGESDQVYARDLADNALRNDAYSAWVESLTEPLEAKTANLSIAAKNY